MLNLVMPNHTPEPIMHRKAQPGYTADDAAMVSEQQMRRAIGAAGGFCWHQLHNRPNGWASH
jgi:hypothetical protein